MKIFLISILFSSLTAVLSSAYYSVVPGSGSVGSPLSASSLGQRTYKSVPAVQTTYVYSDGRPVSSTSLGKSTAHDYALGYGVGSGVGSGLGSGLTSGLDKSLKAEAGPVSDLAKLDSNGASASLRGPYSFGGRGGYPSPYDRYDPYDSYGGLDEYDPFRPRSPRLSQGGYHLGYKLGHGVGYGLGYGLGQGIGRGLNTGLESGSGGDDENGGGGNRRKGRSGKLKNEDKKPTEKEEE